MTTPRIYLDHNATAPLLPQARAAMLAALETCGNPSSVHADGRRARAIIDRAREQVAQLVGARPAEVVLVSGASEANALAFHAKPWAHVMVAAVEHPSVLETAKAFKTTYMQVEPSGRVATELVSGRLVAGPGFEGPCLVSLQLANGETGVLQDVAGLARACHELGRDVSVHCDAVQAAGRVALDLRALGVDYLSLSAHKLGGPMGTGALICREGAALDPLIRGGGQEKGRRAGTENVAAIAGFGAACEVALRNLVHVPSLASLRDKLEAGIVQISPQAIVIGAQSPRLPNTACVAFPGLRAETLVIKLDLAGVSVSAGAACSSGKVKASPTLLAMGLGEGVASSSLRFSLGLTTMPADIDACLAAWAQISGARQAQPFPARALSPAPANLELA